MTIPSCGKKKSETDMLNDDSKVTVNAEINKQIGEFRGKIASAKDDFERSELYGKVSELEFEKGDISSSKQNANDSIKYYPKSALPHYILGKSLLSEGRLNEAETELNTATEIDPKHAPSWYELGNLNYLKSKFDEASKMYQKAIALDPKFYQAYNNLGSTYYALKKGKESEQAFLKALTLKSDFPPLYKNMGLLYERLLNDKMKASANYKEYLKRRPNAPDRAAVKFWISALGK
jgi:tetratricopeptide (TPR) repeat protein